MNVHIRRATINDAGNLSVIARDTFNDTFNGTCTEDDMQQFLDDVFNVGALQKELADENDFCFLAEIDNHLVGYIRFIEDAESFPEMNKWKSIELKRLYVSKDYHGKGIAQLLMNFFLNFIEEKSYEATWLGVWEHNYKAQKFYAKYDFQPSGHTHDFPIGNTPQTDLWLWKFLQNKK